MAWKKGSTFIVSLLMLASSMLAAPVFAQIRPTEPRPTVQADGACPANLQELLKTYTGGGTIFQVAVPNAALYREADLGNAVTAGQLKFGERVGIYVRATGVNFVKLGDRNLCGWIDARVVRDIGTPLQTSQLPGWEHVKPLNPDKIMTVNAKVVVKGQLGKAGEPVRLYAEPKIGPQIGTLGHLTILEVLEVKTSDGGNKCASMRADNCFLLVGGTEEVAGGQPVPSLKGWVEAKDMEVWPTSVAVYWRPDKTDVKVYETQLAARNRDDKKVMASRPDRKLEPADKNIARFPVLKAEIDKSQNVVRYLYNVLVLGQNCLGTGQCADDIGRVEGESRFADILFVIDATESMDLYLKPVAEAVANLAVTMSGARRQVRFEAVVYGDYLSEVGTPDKVQIDRIAPFGSPNNPRALAELVTRPNIGFKDPHGDKPEAPFAALTRAINEARWRTEEGAMHFVVWIGDHGNRSAGRHTTSLANKGYVDEQVTSANVIAAMKAKKVDGFFALQVRGGAQTGGDEQYFKAFLDDAAGVIRGAMGSRVPLDTYIKRIEDLSAKFDAVQVRRNVDAQLLKILEFSIGVQERIDAGKTGSESKLTQSLPVAEFSERFLASRNLPADVRQRLIHGAIGGDTGWVRQDEDERTGDFEYWIAMTPRGFRSVLRNMADLCIGLEGTRFRDDYNNTLYQLLGALTGDVPPEKETISEFLEKKWSIPRSKFTRVYDEPAGQALSKLYQSPEEQGKFREYICRKKALLEYAERNQKIAPNDLIYDKVTQNFVPRPGAAPKPFRWDWVIDASLRYYFIPIYMLP